MARILLTADWHVREDRPRCRIDTDWLESQRSTIKQIRTIFSEEHCEEMWILGDVFERPRCATEYVNMVITELTKFGEDKLRILPGNHDLPYHAYDNIERCSLGTILKVFRELKSGHIQENDHHVCVSAHPFGRDELNPNMDVLCTHQLVFKDDAARPIKGLGKTAQELLDENKNVRYILTGDYHHGYVYFEDAGIKRKSRAVVTPGCINIQKADMADYEPFVVVWDTDKKTFTKRFLDPQRDMVVTDYLEAQEERDERIRRCVDTAKGFDAVELDFRSALDEALVSHSEGVKSIITEVYENINQNK